MSAHLGDRAIIYADGRMDGFVGGACAREIVRQQALELIRTRQSRLVSIRPDATGPSAADPEHVVVPMTCVSEGAVDVYIEPFVHARRLVVVGATPVADILARTAVTLDYDVVRVVDASEQRDIPSVSGLQVVPLESLADELRGHDGIAAVVASQGHYDEDALQVILGAGVAYVGLVASRKRWTTMRAVLADTGVNGLDQVHNPAGLDLGGRTPGEVAVSILAELVQVEPMQRSGDAAAPEQTTASAPAFAVDPVCGMQVEIAGARHVADVNGTVHYFCCANCRLPFPQRATAIRRDPGMIDAQAIRARFGERGFIVNDAFATALQLVLALEKPLLVEGPAGVGKTESAKVLADVLGTRLIRLQCYEGLDALTSLYEWNYPRQMLRIRLTEAEGATLKEREAEIFGKDFLLERPLLEAITQDRSPVLLIDEVDRADEAFEAFLLEVLAEWQVTIPELGTIRARHVPHVVLTSNRTRELSDALRRRCLFFWLPVPDARRRDRHPPRTCSRASRSGSPIKSRARCRSFGACRCRRRRAWQRAWIGREPLSACTGITSIARRWSRRSGAF